MNKLLDWKNRGVSPSVIYDIGAHTGTWTSEVKNYFTSSEFHLFEAFEENKEKNIHPNYNIVLLDKEDNNVKKFYTTKDQWNTGNSTFIELSSHFRESNYNVIYMPTKKLDTYRVEKNIPLPDFIKLDVQGSELDILRGAKECINNCSIILLESSIHQYNKDAPLIGEVFSFMNENNFELIDIIDEHKIKGYLAQVDLLFAKKNSGLRLNNFNF